jgi:fatty-acyl-CoA synthase
MIGGMMQQPLLVSTLLRHAERHHATQVGRAVEGVHRYVPRARPACSTAHALIAFGLEPGSALPLAWNGYGMGFTTLPPVPAAYCTR